MAIPEELPTGLVTGRFLFVSEDKVTDAGANPDYTVVKGNITFTCSAKGPVRVPDNNLILIPLVFYASFDSGGNVIPLDGDGVGIRLPATDSPVYNPTGFTWLVEFKLTDARTGNAVNIKSFSIEVKADQETKLAQSFPVSESGGVVMVQGPPGPAGKGITFKGQVATVSQLPTTLGADGHAYVVTSESSLYLCIGGQWVNSGRWGDGITRPRFTRDYFIPGTLSPHVGMVGLPFNQESRVSSITLSAGSAPTGGSLNVDLRVDGVVKGTSSLTSGNPLRYKEFNPVIVVPLASVVTFDVTTVGPTTPGRDLTIALGGELSL